MTPDCPFCSRPHLMELFSYPIPAYEMEDLTDRALGRVIYAIANANICISSSEEGRAKNFRFDRDTQRIEIQLFNKYYTFACNGQEGGRELTVNEIHLRLIKAYENILEKG